MIHRDTEIFKKAGYDCVYTYHCDGITFFYKNHVLYSASLSQLVGTPYYEIFKVLEEKKSFFVELEDILK